MREDIAWHELHKDCWAFEAVQGRAVEEHRLQG